MGISIDTWVSILLWLIPAGIASLIWLVRLEGKIHSERQARAGQIDNIRETMKSVKDDHSLFQERIFEMLREIRDEIRRKVDK